MKGKHLIYFNLAIIGIFLFVIGCGGGGSSGGAVPNPTAVPPTSSPTNTPVTGATPTNTPQPTPTNSPDWLSLVNDYRNQAQLPPVTENTAWSDGCVKHSTYMVENNVMTHDEDPNMPYYTTEGDQAGNSGNVYKSSSSWEPTFQDPIDTWMQGPFHGVGIIDPQLLQTGFGDYAKNTGLWNYAATLDVLRGGLGSLPSGITFPIMWPGNGKTVPIFQYEGNETPDPRTHAGYTGYTGIPIIIQLGSGSVTPSVTSTSLTTGGSSVEHCWFDETNYINPDGSQQSLGRSVLGGRDAVVILPRYPLTKGATYNVSITTNGNTYSWSFTVANDARNIEDKSNDSFMSLPE